jgi:hypothetical protein
MVGTRVAGVATIDVTVGTDVGADELAKPTPPPLKMKNPPRQAIKNKAVANPAMMPICKRVIPKYFFSSFIIPPPSLNY